MLKALLLGLSCLFAWGHAPHPFYVSILEVNPNPSSGRLECALKIFTDDLELAIKEEVGATGLNLGSAREKSGAGEVVNNYIRTHFSVADQKRPLDINFMGREGDADAQWIYFEVIFPADRLPDEVTIKWTSLLDLLPGQKNLLHLYPAPNTRTFIFDQEHARQIIPLTL